jgi:superfamily II DNA or RNA helicase
MNHVFKYEISDPGVLIGCCTLDDFLQRLRNIKNDNKLFVQHGLEALVEVISVYCGIFNEYEVKPDDGLMIQAIGNKDTGVGVYYYEDPSILLTANRHDLTKFWGNAQMHYCLRKCAIFTNTAGVHEDTQKHFFQSPIISAQFFGKIDLEKLINDNLGFWDHFRSSLCIASARLVVKKLRKHQQEAVEKCKLHASQSLDDPRIKGKVICPTGTGKTLIEAELIFDTIEKDPTAVCVIASPRIVLTYQLLEEISTYFASKKKSAIYFNLNSGRLGKLAENIKKKMKENGLLSNIQIPSSTKASKIKEYYEQAKKDGLPLIVGATYQSAYKLIKANVPIAILIGDECHNLVIKVDEKQKRSKIHFKKEFHKINADKEFFFTATPVKDRKKSTITSNTHVRHWGMQNRNLFGKVVYRTFPTKMIETGEVIPPYVHVVEVEEYKLKNVDQNVETIQDNLASLVSILETSFVEHRKKIKEESCDKDAIGAKLLVTCKGQKAFASFFEQEQGHFKSKAMRDFINNNPGVNLYGISTGSGAFIYENGNFTHHQPTGSSYKEKFMLAIKTAGDQQNALILHINMISEGVDVPGITGVMSYRKLGLVRRNQTIGRAMRLCDIDRRKIYAEPPEILPKEFKIFQKMVKPRCWVIVPTFSQETVQAAKDIARMVKRLRKYYGTPTSWFYSKDKQGRMVDFTSQPGTVPEKSGLELGVQHHLEEPDYLRARKKFQQALKENPKAAQQMLWQCQTINIKKN